MLWNYRKCQRAVGRGHGQVGAKDLLARANSFFPNALFLHHPKILENLPVLLGTNGLIISSHLLKKSLIENFIFVEFYLLKKVPLENEKLYNNNRLMGLITNTWFSRNCSCLLLLVPPLLSSRYKFLWRKFMKDTNELIKTWVMKHDKNIVQRNIFSHYTGLAFISARSVFVENTSI